MNLSVNVKRASLLVGLPGPDKLSLYIDSATPFPEMGYVACFTMDIRKGYGLQYCREHLGIEPEVINGR